MKKVLFIAIVAILVLSIPMAAFAGSANTTHKGVSVKVICNKLSSSHNVTGAGSGSGKFYYTLNGATKSKSASTTATSSAYWVASASISSGTGYKATTTYSGCTVTATY